VPIGVGFTRTIRRTIDLDLSAETLGNPGVNVLATPCLADLCDEAARETCREADTAKLRVDIHHLAATAIGDEVKITAQIVRVSDGKIVCRVSGRDSQRDIVTGTVERRRI
jgi:fluoroacetyl-CoA thioesterase